MVMGDNGNEKDNDNAKDNDIENHDENENDNDTSVLACIDFKCVQLNLSEFR